jgi:hypothetical protein
VWADKAFMPPSGLPTRLSDFEAVSTGSFSNNGE